jgi:hypothetical protein
MTTKSNSVTIEVEDGEGNVDYKTYTLKDMRDWFFQIRGFPSILFFGTGKNRIAGEGQSGGRFVTEVVHRAENAFVEKLGVDEYTKRMDKLMGKTK